MGISTRKFPFEFVAVVGTVERLPVKLRDSKLQFRTFTQTRATIKDPINKSIKIGTM